ncbi:MAG: amidohydrolase family protein [bacterium]
MEPKELWIRNGLVLTGTGFAAADVAIVGEKITAVVVRDETPGETSILPPVATLRSTPPTPPLPTTGDQPTEVDATGLWVLPGGVDAHVHFGMPLRPGCCSLGWRESSEAALLGGTTTVIDFANPERGESVNAAVERWLQRAEPDCLCDFGLHATITEASKGCLAELPSLVARGVPTFKGFLAYKDRLMLTASAMERLMRAVAGCGGKLLVQPKTGR